MRKLSNCALCDPKGIVVYIGGDWLSSFKTKLIRRSLLSRLTLLKTDPSYMRTHTSYSYNPLSIRSHSLTHSLTHSYAEASYPFTHSFTHSLLHPLTPSYYSLTLTLTLTLVMCHPSRSSRLSYACCPSRSSVLCMRLFCSSYLSRLSYSSYSYYPLNYSTYSTYSNCLKCLKRLSCSSCSTHSSNSSLPPYAFEFLKLNFYNPLL